MTYPAILLGVLLSTLYGAGFHFFRGGSSKKLLVYLMLSWLGFWLGDSLAAYMNWSFVSMGVLNVGTGTILSFGLMLIAEVIDRFRQNQTIE